MKRITVTLQIDESEVVREYTHVEGLSAKTWGERVLDMLDTIEKSHEQI